ncbi:hypothetical protein [Halobellus limi]|uniref:Lipoprotein n=1 Tax=Halobellus limi TaxID=699433 RepID=A0A1H5ZPP1_9EURY|nr:hypothetical protein [Halobellus limi]QCC48023.1 hypothetical protein DV707_10350 [Halobellus limi]SEG37637.1 hypothetical protein SAMN04488133_2082 [Halobellus limi]
MPDLTRRRALLAAASGVAALAGCSGESDRPTVDTPREDETLDDYESRHVRNTDGAVLFSQREELPTVTDERGRYARSGRAVLVDGADLEALTFNDVPEAEELRAYAAETDFESASLYLFAMPVGACYEIRLRSVSVEWDETEADDLHPHADFCRATRPADVECGADETHTAGFAIRLPVAAERSSGSGSGMSSSCGPLRRGEPFDPTVTPAGGGEEQ